ncbi:MAG: type III-B CRISPR module-associated Cmr3 family protein [Thiolinea sp.]
MSTASKTWRFSALDTWFRESRPMESMGDSELRSTFPPSPRTLAGAVRSLVGETHQVDWSKWRKPGDDARLQALQARIGDADGLGELAFTGPWLARATADGGSERLFPAPRNLLLKLENDQITDVQRTPLGKSCECDLGRVRMPVLPERDSNLRTAEDCWLTATALQEVLAGKRCAPEQLVATQALFDHEARLGIARNNNNRAVQTGMLYQTRHVRPQSGVYVETDVSGLRDDDYPPAGVVRFGGEGRGAAFSVQAAAAQRLPERPQLQADTVGILLILLTPAPVPIPQSGCEQKYRPLPNFRMDQDGASTVWKGKLCGVDLTLQRPHRQAGTGRWLGSGAQPAACGAKPDSGRQCVLPERG